MLHNGSRRGRAQPTSQREPAILLTSGVVAPHVAAWTSIALSHAIEPRERAAAIAERHEPAAS